jgi:hypothetical protein
MAKIPARTQEVAQARRDANKLGEMLKTEKYWKSISKTPEELKVHFTNHAYNFKEKTRLMSNISDDEMNRVVKEYGLEDEVKKVAKKTETALDIRARGGKTQEIQTYLNKMLTLTQKEASAAKKVVDAKRQAKRKSIVQAAADIKRPVTPRDSAGIVYDPNYSPLPNQPTPSPKPTVATQRRWIKSGYGTDTSPLQSSVKTTSVVSNGSRIKSIISKSLPIASKIASHPVARVAGRGLEVVGLGVAAYDVGKSGLELGSEVKRRINRPPKEYDEAQFNKVMPSRSKIGIKVALPNVNKPANLTAQRGKTLYPKGAPVPSSNMPQVFPAGSSPSRTATKLKKSVGSPKKKVAMDSPSRIKRTIKPTVIPKRPEEITQDMSFLNTPSFTSLTRVLPVRPIPTRVQMPEQFMSPSMRLASLPRDKSRKALGVSQWR